MLFLNNIKKGNTRVKVLKKKKERLLLRTCRTQSFNTYTYTKKVSYCQVFFFQVNQVRFVKIAQFLRSLKKKKILVLLSTDLQIYEIETSVKNVIDRVIRHVKKKTRNVIINNLIFEATVKSILTRKPKYLPEFFSTSVKTNKKKKKTVTKIYGRSCTVRVRLRIARRLHNACPYNNNTYRVELVSFLYFVQTFSRTVFSFSRRLFHNRHSARRRKAPYSGQAHRYTRTQSRVDECKVSSAL